MGEGTTVCPTVEELLANAASAVIEHGDLAGGRAGFTAAYDDAERAADAASMARAALGFAGIWVNEQRDATSAWLEARLRQALPRLDIDDPISVRIRVRLAAESDYRAGRHDTVLRLVDEARRVPDATVRAEAVSLALQCTLGPGNEALRPALITELIEESSRTGRRVDLLMGLLWRTVDAFLRADPHAERRLSELRVTLARADHLAIRYVVHGIEVMLAVRAGRYDEAERLAHDCAALAAAAGDASGTARLGAHLLAVRWFQGRLAETVPLLRQLLDSPMLSAVDNSFAAVLAVAAAEAGDRLTATGLLARLCGTDLARLPRSATWLVTMTALVEAAHRLDDAALSSYAYELLLPHADLPVVGPVGVVCLGSVHYALGVASLTAGDLDRAVEHLDTAVQRNLALAHWPAAVMARQRLARAMLLRGRPGDRDSAEQQLLAAVDDAAAVGIPLPLPREVLPPPSAAGATCVRDGREWRIGLAGRSTRVWHSVGMLHLAVLLANPNTEIPAIELAAGVEALSVRAASPQEILDQPALRQYRRRLQRLRAELDELEAGGDQHRLATVRAEHDWLAAELSASTGIAGRARRFADNDERARIAVSKAIRRALTRIEEADPAIGQHLRIHVHTGARCSYQISSPRKPT